MDITDTSSTTLAMFLQPPLDIVASWPAPNAIDPESRAPAAIAVVCVMTLLSTIFTSLRIYSRLCISRKFGVDDWLALGAFIFFIIYIALGVQDIRYGIGLHTWDFLVHPEWIEPSLKTSLATSPMFVISLCLTKLSILFFYQRVIFTPQAASEQLVKILRATIWVVAILGVIFFFLKIFQCWPVHVYWDHSFVMESKKHQCSTFALYAFACTDVLMDFFIILLPMKAIWSLSLETSKRLQVIGLFSIGTLSLVAGALRIMPIINTTRTYDLTWETATLIMFSIIELAVAICCASVPAARIVFKSVAMAIKMKKASYTSPISKGISNHRRNKLTKSTGSTTELGLISNNHGGEDVMTFERPAYNIKDIV